MAEPTLLVFCRHAKSLHNAIKGDDPFIPEGAQDRVMYIENDLSIPLVPEEGQQQVISAGNSLREQFGSFDVVYCSEAVRSRHTAEGIIPLLHHAPPLHASYLLNERDPGYTFGMTRAQAEALYPSRDGYWESRGWFHARPHGGESVRDVAVTRVPLFRDLLRERHPGGRILVVGHGRWIQAFRIHTEDLPTNPEVPHGRNCGWIEYRCDWNTKRLVLHDDSHWPLGSS